jgi:rhomboid protease GluP
LPAVLHGGFGHIIGNLIIQLYYGFILEATYGKLKVSILYVAGALVGCLFSCIWFPYELSVGASAAIFALIALEVVYFITNFPVLEK